MHGLLELLRLYQFFYLFGGMLVSAWGGLKALLICTIIGMAGGVLLILFFIRDRKQAQA